MKIGFLFPGQGSQYIGMGKDLYDEYEDVRKIYDKVKDITNIDIAHLTFNGSESEINQTKNTQLAILTMSLAILELMKKNNIEAMVSAGLSLGEYTSLIYNNVFKIEDGIKLVQKRGEYMQNLLPEGKWQMAAIIGLEDKKVEELCNSVTDSFVKPVNYNCPGQIIVSGEETGVRKVEEMAKGDARKIIELKTSGPFHTEKMLEAAKAFDEYIKNINVNIPEGIIIKNIDGLIYKKDDDIKEILTNHIVSPVKFSKCIEKMIELGVDTFIEIGPGKTLSGFVKRINKDVNIMQINNVDTLNEVINFVKENQDK